jgi:ABC-2 type transport system ATP-binding protein
MIKVTSLTKRYGETVAVDDLSFTVRPGIVTGFLGPNGAGKSTTMRVILGLDNPSEGCATVNGRPLAEHAAPLRARRAPRGQGPTPAAIGPQPPPGSRRHHGNS